MHECKMLRIEAGNPADARMRNDKEEARRTHQERGRMEVGGRGRGGREVEMEATCSGGWQAGAGLWVKVTFRQVRQFIPQPYGEKKNTTRVGIHESSPLT